MSIRPLTGVDQAAYAIFRRQLWPSHPGGGHWEALERKYLLNPHRTLCPGSDLYGYFQDDRLLGIMGAFPMPVMLKGNLYPGHMLVDWAVLPKFHFSPIAGHLWNTLISLPGRKYASDGSHFSQGPLEKRGRKIHVSEATGVVLPLSSMAAKLLNLNSYSYPSPLHLESLETTPGVAVLEGSQVRAAVPAVGDELARIHRDGHFWEVYCCARIYNGAFPLRVVSDKGEADFVIKVMETGKFRFGTLLSAHLNPYDTVCAKATGKLLGAFFRRTRVCILRAIEADDELRAVVSAATIFVRRSPSYWWSIPLPTDSFRYDQVSWWLTAADRDSHFGGLQPYREP